MDHIAVSVGRSVLVKSTMAAIPNYVTQGRVQPVHLCEKLDKVKRDFLWGTTSEKRKMHLVGWNKIIKTNENGGLGIQEVRAKNIALLDKRRILKGTCGRSFDKARE